MTLLEQVEGLVEESLKDRKDISRAEIWDTVIGALTPDQADRLREEYSDREIASAIADLPNANGKKRALIEKLLDARGSHTKRIAEAKAADEQYHRLQTAMQRANARSAINNTKLGEALRTEVLRQVQTIADTPKDRDFTVSDYKELSKLKAERSSLTTTIAGIGELLMPEAIKQAQETQIEEMGAEAAVYAAIADLLDFLTAEQMQGAHLLQSRIVVDTSSGRSGAFRRKAADLFRAAENRLNHRSATQAR